MSVASHRPLHADELAVDAALVRRLLERQFPRWADLPLVAVPSGTDNLTFRLGTEMAVRLPRMPSAAERLRKELEWLPRLAAHLPLPIPVPLAEGKPSSEYPLPWAITRWIAGESAANRRPADEYALARELARFVVALGRVPAAGGPPPGKHNSERGVPLAALEDQARDNIAALRGLVDTQAALAAWEDALAAPAWTEPGRWIHGDLHGSNLVLRDGRLAAVVDFGCLGVGDPACDLMVAWTYLDAGPRALFRAATGADDACWARGRGWALWLGLVALPYYRGRDAAMEALATRALAAALHDRRRGAAY